MKLEFHGAARSVTGSMHVLESGGSRVLLDCGLFQGRREEANRINRTLPFAAKAIRATILSHAHIDHSGNLPNLVKSGFRGKIWATAPTAELAALMLRDSARIQEGDAEYLNKKFPRGPRIEPNYNAKDAERAIERFEPVDYHAWFEPAPGVRARFLDAGHILGSGLIEIEASEGGVTRRIVFTGDLGRRGIPILRDPEAIPACDVLISESTYGDRTHPNSEGIEADLENVLRGCVAEKGRLIIPAFSIGRSQNAVYGLAKLIRAGRIPAIPVFVDSPLAVEATKLVAKHPEVYDKEMRQVIAEQGSPLFFRGVRYVESVEESKSLNRMPNPIIIISASGMCESGRVLHHLKHAVESSCNVVALVGFQAVHTLGRKLQDGWKRVRILGEEHEVRAKIVRFSGLSAHADREDLLAAMRPLKKSVKTVFLVHGEEDASESLRGALVGEGFGRVEVPERGSSFLI